MPPDNAPETKAPPSNHQKIKAEKIRTDGNTQSRATLSDEVVQEYREALESGAEFPPVVVFYDGQNYWLADGFHRLSAYFNSEIPVAYVDAEVRPGSREDALWFAIGANKAPGLRRSNADKRRAVEMALAHPAGARLSDGAIAAHCGVSQPFVSKLRHELTHNRYESTERTGRDGRTINTTDIGKRVHKPEDAANDTPADEGSSGEAVAAKIHVPTLVDGLGLEVETDSPAGRAFASLDRFGEAISLFRKLGRLINEIAQAPGGEWYTQELRCLARSGEDGVRYVCTDLHNALKRLEFSRPYSAVCPYCHHDGVEGDTSPKCRACKGRGWVTKATFEAAPKEYRETVEALAKQPDAA
jgi:hypothetical protein